ncbi:MULTISPECIES: MFS transporter [Sphingomonas]|uniref:MFS transporter n=1 Tax=Sphingomonas molluscorum TaxID=418184 RepID=A0ABU8Q8L4_9SPHN|nr:MFS transporter [Sphingomonas sp. JUb134]MBM7407380.1 hypothetical protein [Sphingomonas sp. JUb134]
MERHRSDDRRAMSAGSIADAGDAAGSEGRVTGAIVLSALGAALGGLLFGFDTAVISGTTTALQARFALSDASLGFTVASALIGTVIGSLVAGAPADRFGRKPMLLVIAVAYVVSSLGAALDARDRRASVRGVPARHPAAARQPAVVRYQGTRPRGAGGARPVRLRLSAVSTNGTDLRL